MSNQNDSIYLENKKLQRLKIFSEQDLIPVNLEEQKLQSPSCIDTIKDQQIISALNVNGAAAFCKAIKIGDTQSNIEGTIKYANGKFQCHNGINWSDMGNTEINESIINNSTMNQTIIGDSKIQQSELSNSNIQDSNALNMNLKESKIEKSIINNDVHIETYQDFFYNDNIPGYPGDIVKIEETGSFQSIKKQIHPGSINWVSEIKGNIFSKKQIIDNESNLYFASKYLANVSFVNGNFVNSANDVEGNVDDINISKNNKDEYNSNHIFISKLNKLGNWEWSLKIKNIANILDFQLFNDNLLILLNSYSDKNNIELFDKNGLKWNKNIIENNLQNYSEKQRYLLLINRNGEFIKMTNTIGNSIKINFNEIITNFIHDADLNINLSKYIKNNKLIDVNITGSNLTSYLNKNELDDQLEFYVEKTSLNNQSNEIGQNDDYKLLWNQNIKKINKVLELGNRYYIFGDFDNLTNPNGDLFSNFSGKLAKIGQDGFWLWGMYESKKALDFEIFNNCIYLLYENEIRKYSLENKFIKSTKILSKCIKLYVIDNKICLLTSNSVEYYSEQLNKVFDIKYNGDLVIENIIGNNVIGSFYNNVYFYEYESNVSHVNIYNPNESNLILKINYDLEKLNHYGILNSYVEPQTNTQVFIPGQLIKLPYLSLKPGYKYYNLSGKISSHKTEEYIGTAYDNERLFYYPMKLNPDENNSVSTVNTKTNFIFIKYKGTLISSLGSLMFKSEEDLLEDKNNLYLVDEKGILYQNGSVINDNDFYFWDGQNLHYVNINNSNHNYSSNNNKNYMSKNVVEYIGKDNNIYIDISSSLIVEYENNKWKILRNH